jgi:hypothetical protein
MSETFEPNPEWPDGPEEEPEAPDKEPESEGGEVA